jgi:hypothetical protein
VADPLTIALGGAIVTIVVATGYFKAKKINHVNKIDHEVLCTARLTPIREDLVIIKTDIKETREDIREILTKVGG